MFVMVFKYFLDIFANVSDACFKCFIYLLLYVATVASGYCICLQWFLNVLGVFASVSNACFNYFICLLLYVATVTSVCFKSRSDVIHRMRVGSSRWREQHSRRRRRCLGRHGPIADALPRKLDALCARLLPLHGGVRTQSPYSHIILSQGHHSFLCEND